MSWPARHLVALLALTMTMAAMAMLLPALSSGSVQDKIDAKRRHLERVEDRASSLQVNISKMNKKISGLRVQVGSLQRKEAHAQRVLESRQAKLAAATTRYKQEHAKFVRLRKELHRAQVLLAGRLVQIYKSDEPDMATVLLESDGFEDLLTRSEYMNKINDGDAAIVSRVRTLKSQSGKKRSTLVELKERAQVAVDAVENQKRQLASTRSQLSARQGELSSARSEQKDVLGGVREDKHKLEGDLSKLSAQVQSQLGGAPISGPIRKGSGQLIWPVNGTITSPFCERRSWEACHPGIDIGLASGTPIRAADSGTVSIAGPMGGYGNYTCINHGASLQTCYAHQTSIGVSVGQQVAKGQVIGTVGSTGNSTGPHLHFEVRINGAVQNPLNYL